MNPIKIDLSEQEASALSQLIDAAVRAGGVKLAIPGGLLHAKLEAAVAEARKAAPAPAAPAASPESEHAA